MPSRHNEIPILLRSRMEFPTDCFVFFYCLLDRGRFKRRMLACSPLDKLFLKNPPTKRGLFWLPKGIR